MMYAELREIIVETNLCNTTRGIRASIYKHLEDCQECRSWLYRATNRNTASNQRSIDLAIADV